MIETAAVPGADARLQDWRAHALALETEVNKAMVGQQAAVRLLVITVFARGHVLLEGEVGVGKTTLLRALAHAIGGEFERVEGTVDLMPSDLLYHTYIDQHGKPVVAPGPLLKHGRRLATFFFNEVNRARPQVHALLLRAMAERSVNAFDREYRLPHLQVFADRNRVEKEETFEIPAAARDRFMMELAIAMPARLEQQAELMFEPRYHDADALINSLRRAVLSYDQLDDIAVLIQSSVHASDSFKRFALELCQATRRPADYGVEIEGVDIDHLVLSGISPRGMALLIRAARVAAWLGGRDYLVPEDMHAVFKETVGHRVFFNPVYELRREQIAARFIERILAQVAAP